MNRVELLWDLAPSNISLAEDVAQVWCFKLDRTVSYVEEFLPVLSEDERVRANQFKLEHLRCRYIVGRVTLRRLLGEVLKFDPSAITFSYNPHGKPELAGECAGRLHFNISHSAGIALIGMTRLSPVGVDLEQLRPLRYDLEIARRFFTARESASLETLSDAERPLAFFNLWTRKEARLKAQGIGIAESLNRVDISFLPGELARVLRVADRPEEAGKWTLVGLNPADGYLGALAIRASGMRVNCWRFPG